MNTRTQKRITTDSSSMRQVPEADLNLRDFLNKYFFSYWYLYVLFGVLGLTLSYLYAKSITPVYDIHSRLLIKANEAHSVSSERMVLEGLNLLGPSENVVNEIQILSSFNLMQQVIEELGLTVDYAWEDWLKTVPSYKDFPVLVDTFSLSMPALYSEDFSAGALTVEINSPKRKGPSATSFLKNNSN